MPLSVTVFQIANHHRSRTVCTAMAAGIRAVGDRVTIRDESEYRFPDADAVVFYGLAGHLPKVFSDYRKKGKPAVYVDLGYWGRREGGRFNGYHKISVGARHPTRYFQAHKHSDDRFKQFGLKTSPWQKGKHILLAGMSDKAAQAEGLVVEHWEQEAIDELLKHTKRRIIYRPKPSWRGARPLRGAVFDTSACDLRYMLNNCHAVVTHHSNVSIDGLIAGVPAFCWDGVATPMALQNLSQIESPIYPNDRHEWLAAIAYCQWNIEEMAAGLPWRHLKNEGLI